MVRKLVFILLLFSKVGISQVGINTDNPQATLDVNGNVIISEIGEISNDSRLDSIALIGLNGEIKRIDLTKFFNRRSDQLIRVFSTKGNGQSIPKTTPTKVTGWTTTQILNAQEGVEWIPGTGTFTVPKDGWYRVTATLTYARGSIIADSEYNVQVRKNDAAPPIGSLPHFTEAASHTAVNTGLLTTIVQCVAGDKISVWTYHTGLLNPTPLITTTNPSLCTFVIEQM